MQKSIRRGYAAFNAADMKTMITPFDEHATWHTLGEIPIAGDDKGRESVFVQSACMEA